MCLLSHSVVSISPLQALKLPQFRLISKIYEFWSREITHPLVSMVKPVRRRHSEGFFSRLRGHEWAPCLRRVARPALGQSDHEGFFPELIWNQSVAISHLCLPKASLTSIFPLQAVWISWQFFSRFLFCLMAIRLPYYVVCMLNPSFRDKTNVTIHSDVWHIKSSLHIHQ